MLRYREPGELVEDLYHIGCGGRIEFRRSREEWGYHYTNRCSSCGEEVPEEDMSKDLEHAANTNCWECRRPTPMMGRFEGKVLCRQHYREALQRARGDLRMAVTVTVEQHMIDELVQLACSQLNVKQTGTLVFYVSQAVERELRWLMSEAAYRAVNRLWAEASSQQNDNLQKWLASCKAACEEVLGGIKLRQEALDAHRKLLTEGGRSA